MAFITQQQNQQHSRVSSNSGFQRAAAASLQQSQLIFENEQFEKEMEEMMDKMMINLSIMKTELRSCRYTMEEIRSGMKIVEFKYEGQLKTLNLDVDLSCSHLMKKLKRECKDIEDEMNYFNNSIFQYNQTTLITQKNFDVLDKRTTKIQEELGIDFE